MRRTTAVAIIAEAARIFDVEPEELFSGKPHVEHAEAAVRYAFWVVGVQNPGKWLGEGGNAEGIRSCINCRALNRDYNARVGELVWFAQTGMRESANA